MLSSRRLWRGLQRRSLSTNAAALRLVEAYRQHGHKEAAINPLSAVPPWGENNEPMLDLASHPGLQDPVSIEDGYNVRGSMTVDSLLSSLQSTYCSSLGAEFEHCDSAAEREWWAERMELGWSARQDELHRTLMTPARRRNIGVMLQKAHTFESFLARKYTSLKRYSGEGGEAMLPALETIFATAGEYGVGDVVVGMPHRGRLSFLVSLLDYPAEKLFRKLDGKMDIPSALQGLDDVSSHVAASVTKPFGGDPAAHPVHVSLLHNPSHLEAVNPVAMGKTRAKQRDNSRPGATNASAGGGDFTASRDALCVLVHGDGAFSGQGIVPEGLSMMTLPGFSVGGTVHVVVNNQLGFTAGRLEGRSSRYCTDIAKGLGIPVLHVNGEDMEAVAWASRTATAFRSLFRKDVIIDLIGYRRYGHNELDEPAFTQPGMYAEIRAREPFPDAYAKQLIQQGAWKESSLAQLRERLDTHLEQCLQTARKSMTDETGSFGVGPSPDADSEHVPETGLVVGDGSAFAGKWRGLRQARPDEVGGPGAWHTGVEQTHLLEIGRKSVTLPEHVRDSFTVHRRLEKSHVQSRMDMLARAEGNPHEPLIDWATAEALALGSLLWDGNDVRLVGQDTKRGTFSHRHAALVNQEPHGGECIPLNHMRHETEQGQLQVVSSHLSEFAVLGYEYGYSLENPRSLVLWEAQFGDFANGAQIITDQFLATGESKWLRQSGLTLLLPHGFDGAGPEHSSAHPERFLQLAHSPFATPAGAWIGGVTPEDMVRQSDDKAWRESCNFHVLHMTSPANYFHALRRQQVRPFRKPAVIVAPKTLLRHPGALSPLDAFGPESHFEPVLDDPIRAPRDSVERVILCSGKMYFDMKQWREHAEGDAFRTALVRVEELAPFPLDALQGVLEKYPSAKSVVWAQEEPANAGAGMWVKPHLDALARRMGAGLPPVSFAARPPQASPAVGVSSYHQAQVAALKQQLFPE